MLKGSENETTIRHCVHCLHVYTTREDDAPRRRGDECVMNEVPLIAAFQNSLPILAVERRDEKHSLIGCGVNSV